MTKEIGASHAKVFKKFHDDPEYLKAKRAVKPRMDIVDQVIERRTKLGLSQIDLAEKADTHQSRISKIESADFDIRLSTLVSLAEALGCEVNIQLVPIAEGQFTTIDKTELDLVATDETIPEILRVTYISG